MSDSRAAILDWIDQQAPSMRQKLTDWAHINTGSGNLAGLDHFRRMLRLEFSRLGAQVSEIELPPMESIDARGATARQAVGAALCAVKRPEAKQRVFLCIHMDTVYPPDHAFQTCTLLDANTLRGPGVADAKGGLLVMLTALAALERSSAAAKIGWEVLINSDEEIGSMSSLLLLEAAAKRNQVGLLFEPAMADGSLVERRKGSGSFSAIVHGRAAHAGRDFHHGRSAMVAAAKLILGLDHLNRERPGVTVNIGRIDGGGPSNVVPDLAVVRFNVRTTLAEDETFVLAHVRKCLEEINCQDGIRAELHGGFTSPPKIPDSAARRLMDLITGCGRELNMPIQWKDSGGTCDGNKLAAAGLPNVDTLGPCGGNLHSSEEFVVLDSLPQRAKLAALALMRLAEEEGEPPSRPFP